MRQTHTYVELELSPQAYQEIADKLREAGYHHAFMPDGEIDMHGLAVFAKCTYCGTGPCENCMNTGREHR